ncbi:basic leucine zipper transcriptional factor ATF-like 2 [Carlito syrichta]|uniref:Basic leucine zipper transcriptional factor ATF-like 2 n=1 Tax=Carlito syrichta TaxID=1868482 RepID=A0A1U7V0K7_CARSF|nr:basic leucine zipper transcriptional factor ATF-like 2 [Carlito syrichta]
MHLCGGGGLLPWTEPKEHQRQLKKKQKNRVAAQRSRQKHTDKADALHQQHESLEKRSQALRKEIWALQAELAWWRRALQVHERLCHVDCASSSPGCWDQAQQPPGPALHGQQAASPPGHLLSPLTSLSFDPAGVTASPAQPPPSPVLSASPTGSGLLGSSSQPSTLLPSPKAHPDPPQPLGLEYISGGNLGSSPHLPSSAPGPACLQSREHKPAPSAVGWQGLGVDPGPHALLVFPLLSSAQIHF